MKYRDVFPISLLFIKHSTSQYTHHRSSGVHRRLLLGRLLGHGEEVLLGQLPAPAVDDLHLLHGPIPAVSLAALHLPDHIHAADHLPEDDMAPVQPAGLLGRNEELGAVRILACVSHGEPASAIVLQLEVLVSKLLSVDRPATSS